MKQALLIVFILLMLNTGANSQLLIPERNPSQILYLNVGLEPEMVATVGYLIKVNKNANASHYYLGSSFKLAPMIITNHAWRWNITQAVSYKLSSQWNSYLHNDFFISHHKNRAGNMTGLGFELGAAMYTSGKKWNKGFEMGWQYNAATHITHSAVTKEKYANRYPGDSTHLKGPVNGWYGGTGNRLRLGFIIQKKLSRALTWQLNVGTLLILQKQGVALGFPFAQVPAYCNSQLFLSW